MSKFFFKTYVWFFILFLHGISVNATDKIASSSEYQLKIVSRALIVQNNKLLIVSDDNKLWSAPGGQLEKGETLHECLIREVKEETGLTVQPRELVYMFEFFDTASQSHKIESFFICEVLSGQISKDWEDQGGGVKFVEFNSLDEMNLKNVQPTFLKSGKWQRPPFNVYMGTERK